MKQKIIRIFKDKALTRSKLQSMYRNKYYDLFMSHWEIEGSDNQEQHFILDRMWNDGTVGFIVPENMACRYNAKRWNNYNFPESAKPIFQYKIDGVKEEYTIGEDMAIGFANQSHTPVKEVVNSYIARMVEVDMTIITNIFLNKIPFFVNVESTDKTMVNDLIDSLVNDDLAIFFNGSNPLSVANTSVPFISDKLYQHKVALENELLTYLGIDNTQLVNNQRQTVDQVNANNAVINQNQFSFQQAMDQFSDDLAKIGVERKFKPTIQIVDSIHEDTPEEGGNDDE